ncbi:hypothetical protein ACWDXD_24985 [Streptomyces sp. NPDC003314]
MPVPQFTARTTQLAAQIRAARARDDEPTAARALTELLALYVQLGRREIGTAEEQNDYILPRHFGSLPLVLRELGLELSDLPEPPGRRPAPAPDEVLYIAHRVPDPDDPAQAPGCRRFAVDYRPQENVVIDGKRRPYAVVDTEDHHRSTSWHTTLTAAQSTAATANRIRSPR